jgi:hypothetical protein
MERFLKRYKDRLIGSIAGFDRLLFRGTLRSISYVEGLNYFMGNQRVPFKGFKAFVEKFSAGVRARAQQIGVHSRTGATLRCDADQLVYQLLVPFPDANERSRLGARRPGRGFAPVKANALPVGSIASADASPSFC